MIPQVDDLLRPHAGTEKAGRLAGLGKPRIFNGLHTRRPVPSPLHQGIPLAVLGVCQVSQQHLVAAVALAGVVSDEFHHPLARCPYLLAGQIVIAELFLRPDFVFQGTPLEAVGDGRQGAALQALLLQGQPLAVPRGLVDSGDGRHPVVLQPAVHDVQIGIGVGMLRPGIRKEDQVHRDAVLVQADQKGGAVDTAPVGNHIDMFFTSRSILFHIGISFARDTEVQKGGVSRSTSCLRPGRRISSPPPGGSHRSLYPKCK